MNKIVIPIRKPRARQLHETLLATKGGRMRSPRDYNRNELKRQLKRTLYDHTT